MAFNERRVNSVMSQILEMSSPPIPVSPYRRIFHRASTKAYKLDLVLPAWPYISLTVMGYSLES